MAERPLNRSNEEPEQRDSSLEERLTVALGTVPDVWIPTGFAARIAAEAHGIAPTGQRSGAASQRGYGRIAAVLCMAILLALIFSVAHRAALTAPLWLSMEWVFCAQFAILAVWLALRMPRPTLR